MVALAERESGGWIESTYGRGYLLGRPDAYNLPRLRARAENLGYRLITFNKVGSTMPVVDHLIMNDSGPAVVLSDHQTKGVGRKDRVWLDNPGDSILMSVLLRLNPHNLEAAPILADLVALRTAEVLTRVTGEEVKTKYPNDIVFNGKKTAGILVKNTLLGARYLGTNAGIGINVHYSDNELEDFRPDQPATSLDSIADRIIKRESVVGELLSDLRYSVADAVSIAYNKAENKRYNDLWREKSAVFGRNITVLSGDKPPIAQGKVIDTKIGEGILLESRLGQRRWLNLYDTTMKVSIES
jgi:BirA family biotin operon repressor/biotin-[acetyl-CoA-carboxylase] ligase